MERKLVTIRTINNLEPIYFTGKDGVIEEATAIKVATVDGWKVVVRSHEFEVGDMCVFFEIDSIIPRASWNGHILPKEIDKPIRLKTIRLKGQLSQGLALPIKGKTGDSDFNDLLDQISGDRFKYSFYEETPDSKVEDWFKVGEDVTEALGVTKYEAPVPINTDAKGLRPSYIPRTDQERIQNLPHLIGGETVYEVTEKLEGTSITVYYHEERFGVCSRNLELKESDTAYWQVTRSNDLENKLRALGESYAIQGELVGPNIEGNIYGLRDYKLYVYDVFDIKKGEYLDPIQRADLLDTLRLNEVPFLGWSKPEPTMEEQLAYATDYSKLNPSVLREGIVYKSLDGKTSFKAVSNEYLEKNKK